MNNAGSAVTWIICLAVAVLMIVAMWKVFVKAGQPGWAAIVPFYNTYILLKIAGKPGWWLILMFIPLVNIVVDVLVWLEVSRRFGQSDGFVVGLILLPIVFVPMLAFGSAKYQGGAAA
jgi:hypothetical protein